MPKRLLPWLLFVGSMSAPFWAGAQELKTVERVDLQRYLGTWFEIAKFPVSFEKGLTAVTAEYSLRPDGQIKVVNSGRKGNVNGKRKTAAGKAWVVDPRTKAKLKVMFFWPFRGDYWIIDLGKDYEYAVVGHPKRTYLWILCRKNEMDEAVYSGIIERLKRQGYDVSRLEKTVQK